MRRSKHGWMRLGVVLGLTCMGTIVHASAAKEDRWVAGHLFGGGWLSDTKLGLYDWDTSARPAFGAEFAAGWKRMGFGIRFISGHNEQRTQNPVVFYSTRVHMRAVELTAPVRLFDLGGFELSGSGSFGRMWLSYDPDQLEIPIVDSEPLRVDLDPIETWTMSVGGAVSHAVVGPIDVGLSARHRWFELDTAHRVGDGIAYQSQRFGQWEIQLETGWTVDL